MARTFKFAALVLATMVLLVLIATFSLYAAGKLPYKAYLIHTSSMGQTIPPGSMVLIHENQYHVGQVISFKENGAVVTHRLMAINPNGTITTKGDANRTVDPWTTSKSNIIGGVVRTAPIVGYLWFYLFMTWQGPASIAVLIFSILMLWLIYKELNRASPEPAIV